MFRLLNAQFPQTPNIKQSIEDQSVLDRSMLYFDKEGYELNDLEQAYYKHNSVPINRILNHACCQETWIESAIEPQEGPYFDHCMIVTRWDYQEAAREQLERLSAQRPSLNKLLKIKPKWGIDLSMEYQWPNGDVTEVFHIEMDRHSISEINEWKQRVEELVFSRDWTDVAKSMLDHKSEWEYLNSDEQSDWRCRYIGLPRAYDNFKVL